MTETYAKLFGKNLENLKFLYIFKILIGDNHYDETTAVQTWSQNRL